MKVLGLVNLHNSPSLGGLTEERSFGAVSFLSKYALMDFSLANLVNSDVKRIVVLVDKHYESVRKHLFINNSVIDHLNDGYLKAVINGMDSGDIDNIDKNIDVDALEEDYVVIASPKYLMRIDYRQVLKDVKKVTAICDEQGNSLDSYVLTREAFVEMVHSSKKGNAIENYIEKQNEVNKYVHKGLVMSINSLEEYIKISFALLKCENRKSLFNNGWMIYTTKEDKMPVKYGDNAEVSNAFVGPGSFIRGRVKNSIIASNVIIDESANIENCIINSNVYIGQRKTVKNAIVDEDVGINSVKLVSGDKDDYLLIYKGAKL